MGFESTDVMTGCWPNYGMYWLPFWEGKETLRTAGSLVLIDRFDEYFAYEISNRLKMTQAHHCSSVECHEKPKISNGYIFSS